MSKRLLILAVLALTCIAVAACGDDDSGDSTSPTPATSATVWRISGQINAMPSLSVFSCIGQPGYHQALLVGQIDDLGMSVYIFTKEEGALDYGSSTDEVTITVQRRSEDDTVNDLWSETSGNRGASGTVNMDDKASGSLVDVVVPPGVTGSGGATAPITINGEWDCPFSLPTNSPS